MPLDGTIAISGAKNAALPLMAAGLLTDEPLDPEQRARPGRHRIDHGGLLAQLGASVDLRRRRRPAGWSLHAPTHHRSTTAPYDLVRKMRASVLVLGPLLARTGEARVSLPGGCAIGTRPIDLHLKGLEQLGAEIELDGRLRPRAGAGGLAGARRSALPQPSVGATENLLMAAALAAGETVLVDAAREPEIVDLADCLIAMGAQDRGHRHRATSRVDGVDRAARREPYGHPRPDRDRHLSPWRPAVTGGEVELLGARRRPWSARSPRRSSRAGVCGATPTERRHVPSGQWRPARASMS